MIRIHKRIFVVLSILILVTGCGYGFRGTVSYLPAELKTVAIPILENDTAEAGLESVLQQAMIREFNRSKLLTLVDGDKADTVLKGNIKAVTSDAVAFEDSRTAKQRRVAVTVSIDLIRSDKNQVMWRNRSLRVREEYDVSSDNLATEVNRQEALGKLAKNMARRVHDSIFENF